MSSDQPSSFDPVDVHASLALAALALLTFGRAAGFDFVSFDDSAVLLAHPEASAAAGHTNVLQGRAYLVRNAPTDVGANEVSAGGELMLLIVTSVEQITTTPTALLGIGTNGSGEGFAAADLYRIEGHPLIKDNVKADIDPATITLSKRVL